MSDRDKKIILVLLIIAVVALPYVFIIKEKKVETEAVRAKNIELQARLEELRRLDERRDEFIKETDNNNKARDKVIAGFPADIKQENYTMFLLNTEYSTLKVNDEEGIAEFEYPIAFTGVTYAPNVYVPLADLETGMELANTAISNVSVVKYQTYYPGFKYYLDYFKKYADPMTLTSISATANEDTGIIEGEIILAQYAISGEGRTLPDVKISPKIDDLGLRGVEEMGVFGVPDRVDPQLKEGEEQQPENNQEEADQEEMQ